MTSVGSEASQQGYPLVPETGEDGRVRYGAREINRTRDFIAAIKKMVPSNKAGFRSAAGIRTGTANPSGGENGDIYFKQLR